MTQFKYNAFISYSHSDEKWAKWLHKALETYRIPKRVAEKYGLTSRRLAPIFRDRDELATSSDLSRSIIEALQDSAFMVVVCSSAAVRSRWVNEEITRFRELGRADRILACVVDGRAPDVFPPAFDTAMEPLACDLRDEADGRKDGLLKLVAGLLGVSYDELRQRDMRARQQRFAMIAASSFVGMAVMAAITILALISRQQAEEARNEAMTQAAIAEAVNQFLNDDLLSAVSPEHQGKDVLMREVLDTAASSIEKESAEGGRFAGQPMVEASIRSTLGETYYRLGLYDVAAPHIERALSLRRAALGDSDELTLTSMVLMSMLYQSLDDPQRAIELSERVVELSTREFGPAHDRTLEAINNLVTNYFSVGRIAESIDILIPALNARRKLHGPEDSVMLSMVNNLAALFIQQERYEEAVPLLQEVVEARTRVLGPDDPRTLVSQSNLALIYKRTGELAQAEYLNSQVLERQRMALGPEHPNTLLSMNNLASTLIDRGKTDEAESLLIELIDTQTRVLGRSHANTLISEAHLAELYKQRGDLLQAEAITAAALELAEEAKPEGDPLIGKLMGAHGDSISRLGRFAEADELLLHGYRILVGAQGANRTDVKKQIRYLADHYERWQRLDEAKTWRNRLDR